MNIHAAEVICLIRSCCLFALCLLFFHSIDLFLTLLQSENSDSEIPDYRGCGKETTNLSFSLTALSICSTGSNIHSLPQAQYYLFIYIIPTSWPLYFFLVIFLP